MIEVVSPGLYTLIQDLGRDGHYAIGMPPAGAMDQYSHRLANALVGNPPGAATLEATFIGPTLRFPGESVIAVTGAEVEVFVDGEAVPNWATCTVPAGATLSFGRLSAGCRFYLAVRGGVASTPFLGSRSTYTGSKIGGLRGEALAAGDGLPVGADDALPPLPRPGTRLDEMFRPELRAGSSELRVVEGLCSYRFTDSSLAVFFDSEYAVTPESNRTGCRLAGPALEFVEREEVFGAGSNPSNVVDLGYPMGSIQVPNGTQPICLLRDAVTGGGYATLGTVITPDLDRLAQAKSPDTVRFARIGLEQALIERRRHAVRLAAAVESVATA